MAKGADLKLGKYDIKDLGFLGVGLFLGDKVISKIVGNGNIKSGSAKIGVALISSLIPVKAVQVIGSGVGLDGGMDLVEALGVSGSKSTGGLF
jgi:hypothetical protein